MAAPMRASPPARALAGLIRIYQRAVSSGRPPSCRFTPTCSEYARQSLLRFGVLRGLGLAVWRLLRCNPYCAGGEDPVPPAPRRDR
ncbi:MAG: membrane protein insertion efficiency factor YidD [Betaproteobacteria bacterium]|nr:membrane protein insertion efficiency factor YidD [Betaproteobacteria bacterium]